MSSSFHELLWSILSTLQYFVLCYQSFQMSSAILPSPWGWCCVGPGAGHNDPWGSLPTQLILWLYTINLQVSWLLTHTGLQIRQHSLFMKIQNFKRCWPYHWLQIVPVNTLNNIFKQLVWVMTLITFPFKTGILFERTWAYCFSRLKYSF